MIETVARRPRGRPRKSQDQLRRDHAGRQLDNISVWLMVESKLKGSLSRRSVNRACQLIAEEARARRAAAPKVVREMLDQRHKYLLDAGTLRRRYAAAEALRQQDGSLAGYLTRELARLGPWESTRLRRRRQPEQS